MKIAIQWLRSLLFNIQMYVAMFVVAIVFLVPMILSSEGARYGAKCYCRYVVWSARWIIGLKVDVRGAIPKAGVLVAAKHQSFFDILVIFDSLPRSKFVMKQQILFMPIIGQYASRMGCIPVNRGKRALAIRKMLNDVSSGTDLPGQLVIYPQGTRVPIGKKMPFKKGSGVLYKELDQDCVPVALNIGAFWPKRAVLRKQGTAVVEFLEPIGKGKSIPDFMKILEARIEERSTALLEEVNFKT